MLAAWKLDEFGGYVNTICGIVDGLTATGPDVILIPAIAVKFVLLARVSESYRSQTSTRQHRCSEKRKVQG